MTAEATLEQGESRQAATGTNMLQKERSVVSPAPFGLSVCLLSRCSACLRLHPLLSSRPPPQPPEAYERRNRVRESQREEVSMETEETEAEIASVFIPIWP